MVRAIMIGDSLASSGWGTGGIVQTAPGTGFVVSGGPANPIATITTTAPHGLIRGNMVQIANVGDVNYLAPLNGVVVPVVSVVSPTQFTVAAAYGNEVMADGDYSAGYSGQAWLVKSMMQTTDLSWLNWLNQYMKGHFQFVASYAQGGTASSVGKTLIPKIIAGPRADYAFIQYCTNDVNAELPNAAQQCLTNVQAIVAAVKAAGMTPVLCSPPAIGDVGVPVDPASASKTAALRAINDGMKQLADSDPALIFLDTFAQTADPNDVLARFRTQFAPIDGVHLSTFGSAAIAKTFAGTFPLSAPPVDLLPTSATDDATITVNAKNIVKNGMMTGSGGSIDSTPSNTVTGTAPTGWSIRSSGGTVQNPLVLNAASGVVRSDMYGTALDIDIVSADSGMTFQIGSNGAGSNSFGQLMQAGSWYRCGFQITARQQISELNVSGQVFLNFGSGDTPSIYFMSPSARFDNGFTIEAGEQVAILSQPFFVPAQPAQGGYLFINGAFVGPATNKTISIGRAYCNSVQNPYQ